MRHVVVRLQLRLRLRRRALERTAQEVQRAATHRAVQVRRLERARVERHRARQVRIRRQRVELVQELELQERRLLQALLARVAGGRARHPRRQAHVGRVVCAAIERLLLRERPGRRARLGRAALVALVHRGVVVLGAAARLIGAELLRERLDVAVRVRTHFARLWRTLREGSVAPTGTGRRALQVVAARALVVHEQNLAVLIARSGCGGVPRPPLAGGHRGSELLWRQVRRGRRLVVALAGRAASEQLCETARSRRARRGLCLAGIGVRHLVLVLIGGRLAYSGGTQRLELLRGGAAGGFGAPRGRGPYGTWGLWGDGPARLCARPARAVRGRGRVRSRPLRPLLLVGTGRIGALSETLIRVNTFI